MPFISCQVGRRSYHLRSHTPGDSSVTILSRRPGETRSGITRRGSVRPSGTRAIRAAPPGSSVEFGAHRNKASGGRRLAPFHVPDNAPGTRSFSFRRPGVRRWYDRGGGGGFTNRPAGHARSREVAQEGLRWTHVADGAVEGLVLVSYLGPPTAPSMVGAGRMVGGSTARGLHEAGDAAEGRPSGSAVFPWPHGAGVWEEVLRPGARQPGVLPGAS